MKKTYDIQCHACGEYSEVILDNLNFDEITECPACGEITALRVVSPMNLMGNAAYRDGYKRKGFAELRAANQMDIVAANLPVEQRGEVLKEKQKVLDSMKK